MQEAVFALTPSPKLSPRAERNVNHERAWILRLCSGQGAAVRHDMNSCLIGAWSSPTKNARRVPPGVISKASVAGLAAAAGPWRELRDLGLLVGCRIVVGGRAAAALEERDAAQTGLGLAILLLATFVATRRPAAVGRPRHARWRWPDGVARVDPVAAAAAPGLPRHHRPNPGCCAGRSRPSSGSCGNSGRRIASRPPPGCGRPMSPPRGPAPDTCRTPGGHCHAPGRRVRCCRRAGCDWVDDWDCDAAACYGGRRRHRRRHHCDRRAIADDCLVSLT